MAVLCPVTAGGKSVVKTVPGNPGAQVHQGWSKAGVGKLFWQLSVIGRRTSERDEETYFIKSVVTRSRFVNLMSINDVVVFNNTLPIFDLLKTHLTSVGSFCAQKHPG